MTTSTRLRSRIYTTAAKCNLLWLPFGPLPTMPGRVRSMKTKRLLLSGLALLLVCGCASSKPRHVREPVRPVRITNYDPATGRTILEADGLTWYLKGNFTNRPAAPK